MRRSGFSFVVKSVQGRTVVYDWVGSIASAIRYLDQREASGQFTHCFIQKLRLQKSRKRGSRRILYASDPMMVRQCSARLEAA
jgi:hypothetical protein